MSKFLASGWDSPHPSSKENPVVAGIFIRKIHDSLFKVKLNPVIINKDQWNELLAGPILDIGGMGVFF